jgi:hypothetical protein
MSNVRLQNGAALEVEMSGHAAWHGCRLNYFYGLSALAT